MIHVFIKRNVLDNVVNVATKCVYNVPKIMITIILIHAFIVDILLLIIVIKITYLDLNICEYIYIYIYIEIYTHSMAMTELRKCSRCRSVIELQYFGVNRKGE